MAVVAPAGVGAPIGLTGATAATRFVGGTASGAPASGTFAVGDFVVDQTGKLWVCTVAGSPGTWVQVGGSSTGPGTELDYAQITTAATISSNSEGTANTVVNGNSITYDGTRVKVEIFSPDIENTAGTTGPCVGVVLRDSTVLGHIDMTQGLGGVPPGDSAYGVLFDTPSAGTHTYKWQAYGGGTATYSVKAGAGGSGNLVPAFIRVTKA